MEHKGEKTRRELLEEIKSLRRQIRDLGKLKKAHEESEAKFRALMESATCAIFIWDGKKFLYINPALEALTGYTREELLHMNVWDIIHPDFRELIRNRSLSRLAGENIPGRSEFQVIVRGGEVKWGDFSSSMIRYEGRDAIISTAFDITHLKKTEEELRKAGNEFQSVFQAFPDLYFRFSSDGTILDYKAGNSGDLYVPPDFFLGKKVQEVLPEGLGQRSLDNIQKALDTKAMVVWEYALPIGGVENIYEARHLPMADDQVVGFIRNVTERKRAERELIAEKERLAVTLRSIGDGVITTDVEGKIVLMNNVAEKLTGCSSADAEGRLLEEVFPIINEKSRQPCGNPFTQVIAAGDMITLARDAILISRNGTERMISDSGAPIRDAAGNIIGAVLVFRDVTESKRIEEEMMKSQKLESIGILAGGIAHDFNNILTAIFGNISLAKMYVRSGDKAYGKLEEAEKSFQRAKDLTQQLLTFSRGGAPVKKPLMLGQMLRDSVQFSLSGANVKCRFSLPDDLWGVEADEGQINQVINNVIINASQAMPEGGIIEVRGENVFEAVADINIIQNQEQKERPAKYVKITIADQGIGIPREYVRKVFDPYFTTKQRGSGLGLTISYSIIKKHDGYIALDSETGKGTKVTIYLPASGKAFPNRQEAEIRTSRGEGTILMMDDEVDIIKFADELFHLLGYGADFAEDGEEALAMYKKAMQKGQKYDAVIMDLTIPGGMGGQECVKKILEIDPDARVVVSSGYSNDPIMAEYPIYGFRAVISKPYRIDELSRVLTGLIKQGKVSPQGTG